MTFIDAACVVGFLWILADEQIRIVSVNNCAVVDLYVLADSLFGYLASNGQVWSLWVEFAFLNFIEVVLNDLIG